MIQERLRLLAKIVHLHYVDEVSQKEIAERLRLSRPTVSRMIAEAHEQGLVRITIIYPRTSAVELERQLEEQFQLPQAIVVRGESDSLGTIGTQVAEAAADYLLRVLGPNDVLGVSTGTTVARVIQHVPLQRERRARLVVQLCGSPGPHARALYDSEEVVRQMTHLLRSDYVRMPIPIMLESKDIAAVLRSDSRVQELLVISRDCDIALVGIGALGPTSAFIQMGKLTTEDVTRYAALGAVGDSCGRVFDADGHPFMTFLDDQLIAIDLPDLQRIPLVIGVAYGREKAHAICGSLRGKLINTLVTDAETATEILKEAADRSTIQEDSKTAMVAR